MTKNVTFTFEGFKATIAAADDKEVKEALASQSTLTDRYLKIEPKISAAFHAPECYQKGTEARKALIAYLKERHPLADKIALLRAEQEALKAKGEPEAAHDKGAIAHSYERKVEYDVANALRAFSKYFAAKQEGQRTREEKSPRVVGEEFLKSLPKFFKEGSKWPDADQKLARRMFEAVQEILNPNAGLEVAAPRTVGAEAKAPGKVRNLSPEEIAAL